MHLCRLISRYMDYAWSLLDLGFWYYINMPVHIWTLQQSKKTLIWSCMHPDMPTKNVIHFKFKLLHSSVVKTKQTCIFWWYTDVECLHPLSFDISYQLYTLVASFLANPTIIYEKDVTIYMSSSAWDFSFYSFWGNEKKA